MIEEMLHYKEIIYKILVLQDLIVQFLDFKNEQECESNFILDENGNEVYGSWIYQTDLASYASDATI